MLPILFCSYKVFNIIQFRFFLKSYKYFIFQILFYFLVLGIKDKDFIHSRLILYSTSEFPHQLLIFLREHVQLFNVMLIPLNESKNHYPNSLVKLCKFYFLSDRDIFLFEQYQGSQEKAEFTQSPNCKTRGFSRIKEFTFKV